VLAQALQDHERRVALVDVPHRGRELERLPPEEFRAPFYVQLVVDDRPGVLAEVAAGLAALVFVATWGNVLDPLFFVPDPRWATLPLAVRSLAALPAPSQPVMLAGAVVATVPAIAVVWVLLRRAASGFGRER